uniref:Transmembrane 9 superfamily member n=1 Tax=Aureoumbra lagunensis TaxID=44058 RepID=A0A7S3JWC0_9STRA|mmetsp:Transcript_8071/g.12329  ORF Transcript_8071/g.12329 Transcript_8071/m.12329 type:complete len:640 (+) Transcript_8071:72-1991(+)
MTRKLIFIFGALVVPICVNSISFLPGVAPQAYESGNKLRLYVNKLTSTKTQIPYDYYRLPFCHPKIHLQSENIGERLAGDRIENSLYELRIGVKENCKIVCRKRVGKSGVKQFVQAIDDDYRVHWIVDNLPASTLLTDRQDPSAAPYHVRGFPVGFTLSLQSGRERFLFNHVRIVVSLHQVVDDRYHVVGFRAEPFSIKHSYEGEATNFNLDTRLLTCNDQIMAKHDVNNYLNLDASSSLEIIFTYDVEWEQSNIPWSSRWDVFLASPSGPDDKIHWFSITNSTMIVVFLTLMVAMILVRTLNKDIASYNAVDDEDKEESGWKLVHADVFRPPAFCPLLLSVLVGSGAQLGAMALLALSFAVAGLLSPANRGSLITAMLMLFVFMGSVGGYASARIYKSFHGLERLKCTTYTAIAFPSLIFFVFIGLDLALTAVKSTGAVPFSTLAALLALWFGVSAPLVFFGAYFGYRRELPPCPVRTNQIPRQIPPQPWYMKPLFTALFGGILPFGAVSVELFFVMSAIWLHQIYYIFGFLFLVVLILIATCAEIAILLCYFQLCNEDYRWWWRSVTNSGACALYVYVYAIWYYLFELNMASGLVPTLLYFGYMSLISLVFFLITGNIGLQVCSNFIFRIYASIKVD